MPEAVVEVTDFEVDYGGDWGRVWEEVEGINRTGEDKWTATAMVHVVESDRLVEKIGEEAFRWCSNLVKVTAPFFEEVGWRAFGGVYLRHLLIDPDAIVRPEIFTHCFSLEALAASVGFKLDTGDKMYGRNDPNVGITRFRSGATRWTLIKSATRPRW